MSSQWAAPDEGDLDLGLFRKNDNGDDRRQDRNYRGGGGRGRGRGGGFGFANRNNDRGRGRGRGRGMGRGRGRGRGRGGARPYHRNQDDRGHRSRFNNPPHEFHTSAFQLNREPRDAPPQGHHGPPRHQPNGSFPPSASSHRHHSPTRNFNRSPHTQQQRPFNRSPSPNAAPIPPFNRPASGTAISDEDIPTKCAYATMVINNWEYISGAFTLMWSLKTCGSQANRVIIIDEEINKEYGALIEHSGLFTETFVIPNKLKFKAIQKHWKRYQQSGIYDWIDTSFNKYWCFMLTKYSRVIMLDADQIATKNPDLLFKLDCPAGICSLYKENDDETQNQMHGRRVPNGDIRRSYERNWGVRGCLFMIEPKQETFNRIHETLKYQQSQYGGIGDTRCFIGADEKFLTQWYMTQNGDYSESMWTHIHTKFSRLSYIDKTALSEDPYFLHYCTFKPWKSPGSDQWKTEQWEDLMIWVFVSTSCWREVGAAVTSKVSATELPALTALIAKQVDATFYSEILQQPWSPKYLQFGSEFKGDVEHLLLGLYKLMGWSFKQMQMKKQQESQQLKEQMRTLTVNNKPDTNHTIPPPQSPMKDPPVIPPQSPTKVVSQDPISTLSNHSNPQQPISHPVSIDSTQQQNGIGHIPSLNGSKSPQKIVQSPPAPLWSFDYSKTPLLAALMTRNIEQIPDKVIWQFWHEAEEKMPVNIRFSIQTVRDCNPKWKHILITPQNIWNYLDPKELPPNILRFDKMAHISDVVRVAVLARYGGIYCDATTICFQNGETMSFDHIWDSMLMEQGLDFVGFRYDQQFGRWRADEKFCCWFMATKKENGLFSAWLRRINLLIENKTTNSALQIVDALYPNEKGNAFKKYVILGPGILDQLFEEYCHYHRNFRYHVTDPRECTMLDHNFNLEQTWYLRANKSWDFQRWFGMKKPSFIKLFCAKNGTEALYQMIRRGKEYTTDAQVTLQDVLSAGLILSDIFQFAAASH